jgi:hypothetical protein
MSTPSTVVDAFRSRQFAINVRVVVDLTDVTFMDSIGLFVIGEAARRARDPWRPRHTSSQIPHHLV